jgi:hypothetical protein
MGISDCDRGIDRTHVAILNRRSGPLISAPAEKEVAWVIASPVPEFRNDARGYGLVWRWALVER